MDSTNNKMPRPLVSVVIPAYNCSAYIGEAVDSVLAQTYDNIEIIVVDGSDDDTKSVLAPYLDRITYLYQSPSGVAAARNAGVQKAQGELIAFVDADDVWMPAKLSIQVDALHAFPEAGIIFSDNLIFDESGVLRASACVPTLQRWLKQKRIPGTELAYGSLYVEMLRGNCIGTCSSIVKKMVLDDVGLFDENFKICEDYDLWLRIAKTHHVLYVNRVLSKYRVRPEGLSGSLDVRQLRWEHYTIRVREKHLQQDLIPREMRQHVKRVLSQACWNLGWDYFYRDHLREARSLFFRSGYYRPWHMEIWLSGVMLLLPLPIVAAIRKIVRQFKGFRVAQFEGDL